MSTKYKTGDNEISNFITYSVVNWIDALTRNEYKDIIVESLKHCIDEKGMILNAWISTPAMLRQCLDYLHNNPVRAGIVFEPQNYIYSSAVDYYTNKKGMIEIEHLQC